jgi:hypothetical protein
VLLFSSCFDFVLLLFSSVQFSSIQKRVRRRSTDQQTDGRRVGVDAGGCPFSPFSFTLFLSLSSFSSLFCLVKRVSFSRAIESILWSRWRRVPFTPRGEIIATKTSKSTQSRREAGFWVFFWRCWFPALLVRVRVRVRVRGRGRGVTRVPGWRSGSRSRSWR